jgi:hypothetical protein
MDAGKLGNAPHCVGIERHNFTYPVLKRVGERASGGP